jgi:hydroxymethylbilane synthase
MIIGSRGSDLALRQVDIFIRKAQLKDYSLKIIKTKGDMTKKSLQESSPGMFTKAIDEALQNEEIDIAVHSLKDIPVEGFPGDLEIACIAERGDPRDCLIGEISDGATIGTDSIRREYELRNCYRDFRLEIKSLRGNIPTRIEKLKMKKYDGIIAAKCAIERLGLNTTVRKIFAIDNMVPAAGQGAIAAVIRKGDRFDFAKKDEQYICCMLEREFIRDLGGCKKPVGAYCEYKDKDERYTLTGLIYKDNKRVMVTFSGDEKTVIEEITEWKAKHIL